MPPAPRLPHDWSTLDLALYLRISQDRQGRGLGVARQDGESSELIASYNADPDTVPRYVDNDLSATGGKHRPEYETLIREVTAGRVVIIVAWSIDRLTRSVSEMLDLIELRGTFRAIATVDAGIYDLKTASGRNRAIEAAAKAQYEAEHKGERHTSAHNQAAAAGRRHGGPFRAFGYRPVYEGAGDYRRVIREDLDEGEADIIRECARRVLSGEPWRTITRDLAARGVVGTRGKPFTPVTLKIILSSARISGRREHHGEIASERADWPAIIDAGTSDRLRARIRKGRGTASTPVVRRHLLSGILRCGKCGYQLTGCPKRSGYVYVCQLAANRAGGCGRLSITMAPTDRFVRDAVLTALDGDAFWARLAERRSELDVNQVLADLRELEDDLEALAADLGARRVRHREWSVARAGLEKARDELLAKLAADRDVGALVEFQRASGKLLERWDAMNVGQQRALIEAVIVRVTVRASRVAGRGFDAWRLEEIEWRV